MAIQAPISKLLRDAEKISNPKHEILNNIKAQNSKVENQRDVLLGFYHLDLCRPIVLCLWYAAWHQRRSFAVSDLEFRMFCGVCFQLVRVREN